MKLNKQSFKKLKMTVILIHEGRNLKPGSSKQTPLCPQQLAAGMSRKPPIKLSRSQCSPITDQLHLPVPAFPPPNGDNSVFSLVGLKEAKKGWCGFWKSGHAANTEHMADLTAIIRGGAVLTVQGAGSSTLPAPVL